jgi:hypothetical protein
MMSQIKGFIQAYSRRARDLIIEAGQKVLLEAGIEGLGTELFACVDELIKNAVKANYKFLLLRERITENFRKLWPDKTPAEIAEDIDDLIKLPESFNRLAIEVLHSEDISGKVREILNEEATLLDIKNHAYLEKRAYTAAELETIRGLKHINDIRARIKEHGIKIILKIQSDAHFIYIEVTNTAPILARDLERVHEKREEHRRYRKEGREHEFFIENLDESESGFGLGYAKIDVILYNWGLDPERAVTLISSINTTVMLTLPIDELKSSVME